MNNPADNGWLTGLAKYIILFLENCLHLLIDGVRTVFGIHRFAMAKYMGNVILVDVDNLICCVFGFWPKQVL